MKTTIDNSCNNNEENHILKDEAYFSRINAGLARFLDASPDAFHATENMKNLLEDNGFTRLLEGRKWNLSSGGSYYVTRNDSALIAFRLPEGKPAGFQIMASHCDSPMLKIKPNAEITVENNYVKLNVEKYGGMILSPWLDRPLSVAGRITVNTADGVETRLVNIDRDLLVIPNLAIHMDRTLNDGYKFNPQVDMLPLFSDMGGAGKFMETVAEAAGVPESDILDTDLFLYDRTKAARVGLNGEFILSGRLDDLQCAYASLMGLIDSAPGANAAVHCVFDNEEVGSGTKQGAASTFLRDVLRRIISVSGGDEEDWLCAVQNSFMVSADNAQAVHPNHTDRADPVNRPYLNQGIVIKYSANQKYTTDAVSGGIFRKICRKAGVPWQTYANRSDMPGGSTLGNISATQVAMNTVDVGLPQLAMHSACETAGILDTAYLARAAEVLFSCSVSGEGDGDYSLNF